MSDGRWCYRCFDTPECTLLVCWRVGGSGAIAKVDPRSFDGMIRAPERIVRVCAALHGRAIRRAHSGQHGVWGVVKLRSTTPS